VGDERVVKDAIVAHVDVPLLADLLRLAAVLTTIEQHVTRLLADVLDCEPFGRHEITFPSSPRGRTGCSLRIETRLNVLIVNATHSAAAKAASPSTLRAPHRSALDSSLNGMRVAASATASTAVSRSSNSDVSRQAGSRSSFCCGTPAVRASLECSSTQ